MYTMAIYCQLFSARLTVLSYRTGPSSTWSRDTGVAKATLVADRAKNWLQTANYKSRTGRAPVWHAGTSGRRHVEGDALEHKLRLYFVRRTTLRLGDKAFSTVAERHIMSILPMNVLQNTSSPIDYCWAGSRRSGTRRSAGRQMLEVVRMNLSFSDRSICCCTARLERFRRCCPYTSALSKDAFAKHELHLGRRAFDVDLAPLKYYPNPRAVSLYSASWLWGLDILLSERRVT